MKGFTCHSAPIPSPGWPARPAGRWQGLVIALVMCLIAPGLTMAQPSDTAASATDTLITLIPVLTGEGTPLSRKQAALEILQLGREDGIKAIAGILALKNNVAAKSAICEAVAGLESPPSQLAEPLLAILAQREPQLRSPVVSALSRFTEAGVTAKLKAFLDQEQIHWLRTEHVARSKELYGLLKEAERLARLHTWLKAAQPLDRLTALEIIHGAMRSTAPTAPTKEVVQQIRQMLRDPDESVRTKVVVVLRDLQEKEDAAKLAAMLDNEKSPAVLEEIYIALGRMGSTDSISACIKGLQNPDETVAAGAADALGRLCRKVGGQTPDYVEPAVQSLLARIEKPVKDSLLRAQIIAAMAVIADSRFIPVLVAGAESSETNPQIRQAALSGLGAIGDPKHIALLVQALSADSDSGVREAAAEALGKLGNRIDDIKALASSLSEPSQAVQNRAWAAYRLVFGRLTWAERMQLLATWAGQDKTVVSRRIDLLNDLESQAAASKADVRQLTHIREELGDDLALNADYSLAAGAYARALEALPADQIEIRAQLAGKLMDTYLRIPALSKAVDLAASAKLAPVINVLAERVVQQAQELSRTDGKATQELIDRFKSGAPQLFNARWGPKLDEIRRTATQPSASPSVNGSVTTLPAG